MSNVVTLLLADQHVLVAEGLGMLLAAEDDLDVLGLAHHSGQAIELAAKHQPTVVVLDAVRILTSRSVCGRLGPSA